MQVQPPGEKLKAGLAEIGERMTAEWVGRAGDEEGDRRRLPVRPLTERPNAALPYLLLMAATVAVLVASPGLAAWPPQQMRAAPG